MEAYFGAFVGVVLLAIAISLPSLANKVMLWDAPWLNKPLISRTKVRVR